ncbi:MAG: DUF3467 domain-containing protein [Bacteroidales bacterium]|nr:DUF3467 domain-containing protein [Bacteroidales bacterium]
MDNNETKQVSIDLKPEIAKGSYSNLAIISHSPSEFVIDFATILPGMPKPDVSNRIVMNPEHAKRLLAALSDNISKYENQFGPIRFSGEPKGTFNLSDFGPINNGSKS